VTQVCILANYKVLLQFSVTPFTHFIHSYFLDFPYILLHPTASVYYFLAFFYSSLPTPFFVLHFLYSLIFPVFRSFLLLLSPLLSIPHYPSLLSFLPYSSWKCVNARYRKHSIPSLVIRLGTSSSYSFATARSWPGLPKTAVLHERSNGSPLYRCVDIHTYCSSQDGSVKLLGCGLDYWPIFVRLLAGMTDLSLICSVQTGARVHAASYRVGNGSFVTGYKAARE